LVDIRLDVVRDALKVTHLVSSYRTGHGCMDRLLAEPLGQGQPDAALGQPVKDSGPKRPHATKAAKAR
jgi:hypothetical protein